MVGREKKPPVAGERSFHELQQVRAFLKMLGLGAEFIKDALRQFDRGPLGFRAERFAHGQSSQERWFRQSRQSGKEQWANGIQR